MIPRSILGPTALIAGLVIAALSACDGTAKDAARPVQPTETPKPPEVVAEPGAHADAGADTPTASTAVAIDDAPRRSACPPEMALVDRRFCIDRWEATTTGADDKPHSPYHSVGSDRVIAESRPGVVPQAYISMEESELACKRAGKRLCTTEQWVTACMGTERPKRTYPYGAREKPGACNVREGGAHPLLALHAGRRPTDSVRMNDPRINQLASTVAPTQSFEECATPEGVHNLVGNLLEWTRGDRPLLMGGYYLDGKENGDGCKYVTMLHGEQYHDFSTGFRCCYEPDKRAIAEVEAETRAASVVTPTEKATPIAAPATPSVGGDPAGFRSFSNPFAPLPAKPSPPAYEPADAACPVDMALAEGQRCDVPEQRCLRWLVVEGQEPERSCAEFEKPTKCKGATREMRYCIDRYEYTPKGWSLPLVHVSWSEAQMICRAMDKRLCGEDEWEFACEGPEAFPYPYGHTRDGAACNHDQTELFDPRGKLIDRRVATDSRPGCKSPFGVFNIVGNVDEWTTRASREPPWRSILRGGWWLTGRNRCRAATESHNEIYAGPQTGFRCCKAAKKP